MKNRFQKRSGVYTCEDCGKQTRDTGRGEADLGLCAHCMELGEWINFLSDGGDLEEVPEKFRKELE